MYHNHSSYWTRLNCLLVISTWPWCVNHKSTQLCHHNTAYKYVIYMYTTPVVFTVLVCTLECGHRLNISAQCHVTRFCFTHYTTHDIPPCDHSYGDPLVLTTQQLPYTGRIPRHYQVHSLTPPPRCYNALCHMTYIDSFP